MYYTHFGLYQPPYKITPDTGAFFRGADRGDILNALVFAIKNGEAITKVVGEVGSGKTMLCRMLQEKLSNDIEIAFLSNPNIEPEDILPAIAMELGLRIHEDGITNRLHVLKTLEQYLLDKHANKKQVVVLVEEAQGMPLASLEEIRLLSNLETNQHKLLQIVLFGQPELDQNLSASHVRQIKDRITHSLYLPPIKLDDIREYLLFRLKHAGYSGPNLFSKSAVWLIAHFSKGLMRRINILADKALLAAYAQNATIISWNHVLAARGDSEFSHGLHYTNRNILFGLAAAISIGVSVLLLANISNTERMLASTKTLIPLSIPKSSFTSLPSLVENSPIPPLSSQATSSLFTQRRNATANWLATTKPTDYSIQILLATTDSEYKIEELLRQPEVKPYLTEIFISKSQLGKTTMFNVLYGGFTSVSKATEALNQLPKLLLESQPYIRNMRDIQAS